MVILRLMGCESVQFGSMERYLVRVTRRAAARGNRVIVAYDREPAIPEFGEALRAAGGELVSLGLAGRGVLGFWRDLGRVLRVERVDVIHAYFTPTCHLALMLAWLMRVRVRVRTSANMPWTVRRNLTPGGPLLAIRFALKQRVLSLFTQAILVLSEAMRDEYLSLGVRGEKVVVVEGGVDEEFFRPGNAEGRMRVRTELGLASEEVAVGCTARLVPMKGLEHLVAAAGRLADEEPNARVLLAGDGPLRSRLERKGGPARLVGHRRDTADFLAALDIFVLPSLSEGLSNSLMEAMACGKACVVSDTAPNRTLITDGVNGILVPVRNEGALAAAVRRLVRDEGMRLRLGIAARETICGRFTVDRRVEREQDLYERLGH